MPEFLHSSQVQDILRPQVISEMADQFGSYSPLLKILTGNGAYMQGLPSVYSPRVKFSAADEVDQPLQIGSAGKVSTYRGSSVINTDQARWTNTARQKFGQYVMPVSFDREEMLAAEGSGDLAIQNLYEKKVKNAMFSIMRELANDLYFNDAERVGAKFNAVNGLKQLCSQDRVWMGIDSTDAVYWEGYYDDIAHEYANVIDPDTTSYLPALLGKMCSGVTIGNLEPNLIVAAKGVWDLLESILGNARIQNGLTAFSGYSAIQLRNTAVIWDTECPAGYAFALNTKPIGNDAALYLIGRAADRSKWFDVSNPIMAANQVLQTVQVTLDVNLFCAYPRLQGVTTKIATA